MPIALLSHIRGDTYGGAEKLFSDIAKLLSDERGFDVIFAFATSYDFSKDLFDLKGHNIRVINTATNLDGTFLDSKYAKCRTILGFYHSIKLRNLIEENEPDLVLIGHEAFAPLECITKINKKFLLMHYVHNPYEFVPDPANSVMKIFGIIIRKFIIKDNNFSDIVLANSNFTKNNCIKTWKRSDCIVLYPFIKAHEFAQRQCSKEDICLVLSRISPEKRIELAIEAFNSKKLLGKRLIVAGYLSRENKRYYARLLKMTKYNTNIKILPNVNRDIIIELLLRSKVLFHPNPNEHFGIAVAEAMAAGCFPVVYASGGPYEIIGYGQYGLAYKTPNEIPDLLEKAFNLQSYFESGIRNRVLIFDINEFRKKFFALIDNNSHTEDYSNGLAEE